MVTKGIISKTMMASTYTQNAVNASYKKVGINAVLTITQRDSDKLLREKLGKMQAESR